MSFPHAPREHHARTSFSGNPVPRSESWIIPIRIDSLNERQLPFAVPFPHLHEDKFLIALLLVQSSSIEPNVSVQATSPEPAQKPLTRLFLYSYTCLFKLLISPIPVFTRTSIQRPISLTCQYTHRS